MSRNRKVAIPLSRGPKNVILVVGIKRRRPREARAPANLLGTTSSVKDVVGCSLRLCGGVNQKPAIVAQLLKPAGDIASLITNDCV